MKRLASSFRAQARSSFGGVPKFYNLSFAFEKHGKDPESFLGSLVAGTLSNGGRRAVAVTDAGQLHGAVMDNPYLGRYFKTILAYILSFSQAWSPALRTQNFEPEAHRDHWTDMTLALYARSGDIVVTEDKALRGAVCLAGEGVRSSSARELTQVGGPAVD